MSAISNFASVKLPVELVSQAKEAAQPLRRSAAGQIEYWATLGRVVEHSGLTAQEARTAIEAYEAAARQAHTALTSQSTALEALTQRVLAASTSGSLQAHVRRIVESNHALAAHQAEA